ncbi:MAG TPA: hypothetical protein PLJ78_09870 [Anaerolineae bacterium]|nr:hypothetical protein [Anaerolineae bacterium]HQK14235.1 hypothetical protein [Anaerolineae bacterium]
MINRAREIAKTMGYDTVDEILQAIGSGELILFKIAEGRRTRAAEWLRTQISTVRQSDPALAATLEDIVSGLELASELAHYPVDADVCDLDLPHGWPSYCERSLLE